MINEYKIGCGKDLTFIDKEGRSFVVSGITDVVLSEDSNLQEMRVVSGCRVYRGNSSFEMRIEFTELKVIEPEESKAQTVKDVSELVRMIR